MQQYSIGYRMNFDNVFLKDIRDTITNYLELFDRYEIKVTKNLISSRKINLLLDVSKQLAAGKYSLHLPKDILTNESSYHELLDLITIFCIHESSEKIYLITHLPYNGSLEYLQKILNISEILPNNYVLLLENEQISSDNCEYLKQINSLFYILNKQHIFNVGFCLDIGHLLFGFFTEGIAEKNAFLRLQNSPYILSAIKELHIHDYLNKDHLQLHQGIMNLDSASSFILKNNLIVPIIIESTVKEPKIDGINQINLITQYLQKHYGG